MPDMKVPPKGKPRMGLVPYDTLTAVADAFESGVLKGRTAFNWRDTDDLEMYRDSLGRHFEHFMTATEPNEDGFMPCQPIIDPESGCDALGHLIANAMICMHILRKRAKNGAKANRS